MNKVHALPTPLLMLLLLGACTSNTAQQAQPQTSAPASTATTERSSPAETSTPTPSATKAVAVEYDTLKDLRDAAMAAGYKCPNWNQNDVVTNASESGTCTDDDVFATYVSDDELQAQITQNKSNNQLLKDHGIAISPTLVGPDWTISLPNDKSLQKVRATLGGRVLH